MLRNAVAGCRFHGGQAGSRRVSGKVCPAFHVPICWAAVILPSCHASASGGGADSGRLFLYLSDLRMHKHLVRHNNGAYRRVLMPIRNGWDDANHT